MYSIVQKEDVGSPMQLREEFMQEKVDCQAHY